MAGEDYPITGGISKVVNTDDHIKNVDLLKQHIHKLEDSQWEVVEIHESHQQVVAGMKYYFTGHFKDKNDNTIYKAKIWLYQRPWENFSELGFDTKDKIE